MVRILKYLFLFFIIIVFSEAVLYLSASIKLNQFNKLSYSCKINIPELYLNDYECDGSNNCYGKFRQPDGIELKSKNKSPIVIFGGSFAHGDHLTQNQTFSYKLSKQLKRPVYNRGMLGRGLATMYYQTTNDDFYNNVPKSDTVIYIMIDDHYRRMLSAKFHPLETFNIIHYKYNDKTNDLKLDVCKNPFICFLKSTYIYNYYKMFKVKIFITNPKYSEKLIDMALTYIIKSRENLEKKWNKKIKFIVIMYDDIKYANQLKEKLEKNNFTVIKLDEHTNVNLDEKPYRLPDLHPSEMAWDLLTPLIIKQAKL